MRVTVIARDEDGTETDITEGVQAMYDLVIGSMDWGSGFWSAEDALPVAKLARVCGFPRVEEAERYLQEQMHSEEQQIFLQRHNKARDVMRILDNPADRASFRNVAPPHDHVFSSAGRCMWSWCEAREEQQCE